MKRWIQLTKHFQGGSRTDYKFLDTSEIDTYAKQQELMENWGENTDGGHNYGYKVDMLVLKKNDAPPVEWLEKQLSRARKTYIDIKQEKVVTKKQRLQRQKDLIGFYKQLVEKKVDAVKEKGNIVTTTVPGT
jgi:hypothetical protein